MNRINIITLGTKDIVRAHEFYKKLGFATAVRGPESSPHIIFFKNEGTKIALYPLEDLSKDIDSANPPTVANGFTGFTLAYNAKTKEEVDELMKKAHVAGATIQKTAKATDWGGYGGYFTDLDGFFWEVAHADSWEFDENNMLIIED
ncbi:MAG: VOC family protein [Psychrobacillus sp.]